MLHNLKEWVKDVIKFFIFSDQSGSYARYQINLKINFSHIFRLNGMRLSRQETWYVLHYMPPFHEFLYY